MDPYSFLIPSAHRLYRCCSFLLLFNLFFSYQSKEGGKLSITDWAYKGATGHAGLGTAGTRDKNYLCINFLSFFILFTTMYLLLELSGGEVWGYE